jgi:serine/threonine protein kinase/Tol biopolymer transport system component
VALPPGARLGHYEILAGIGAGGMGEIYRARDPRLDREVAIKVIAPALSGDAGVLARFEREAMSVARLSHANILAIHEFGQEAGTAFVVMELIDGETLRARLEAGALPARRAVTYALQIARGVAAAHARGVAHRDLKPENVMITREDQVKILDFGLAKPLETGGGDLTRGGGLTTHAGFVVGTFGYMAPEQVRGLSVDHRADIFAIGALLYEMLTGQRAFHGATAADTMSAILTGDPPEVDSARVAISPGLDRIVRRCLEKSPDLRFQSATDLAFALETLSTISTAHPGAAQVPPEPSAAAPRGRLPIWVPWTVAAVAALAAAAAWIWKPAATPAEIRWSAFTRVTESAAEETSPSLSPDGNTVVYAMTSKGNWGIYSQRVGGRNPTPIVDDPQRNERGPAFSADGSLIAFHESGGTGGIFVAGATGESVRRLTDFGFDPAWSPDGKQIAFATEEVADPSSRLGDSTLYVVEAGGGSPRKVIDGDAVQPAWSPSGDRIAYWSNIGGQRDINIVAATGGQPVAVTRDAAIDWCPVWSPDGRFIYFGSDRGTAMNLWRIAVDPSTGRASGTPEPVTAGVHASAGLPRFSRDGTRLAFRSRVASINPVLIPLNTATTQAGTPSVLDASNNVRIPGDRSPDGNLITYYNIGEHQEDVFVGPARGGAIRRIIDDPARDRGPVFMPDGRSLVFYSNRGGTWEIWTIDIDGGGLRKLTDSPEGGVYPHVSPKGNFVVYAGDSGRRSFLAPIKPTPAVPSELPGMTVGGKVFTATDWSPDGARLAGSLVSSSGRPAGIGIYDLSSHSVTELSADQTYAVKWFSDSRRVAYFTGEGWQLVVLDTVNRKRVPVTVALPGPASEEMFAISRDDKAIYYGAAQAASDIWIVERK